MSRAQLVWAVAVAVVTAAWVGATVGDAGVPGLATGRAGTAAAAAAAALAGAAWAPRGRRAAALAAAGLVVLPLAVAAAAGGSALLLVAFLAGAGATETVWALGGPARNPGTLAYAAGVVAASGCLAAALVGERGEGTGWSLPAGDGAAAGLALLGAGLLVVLATVGPRRARPLVVPGLLAGIVAAPTSSPTALAVSGVAAAVVGVLLLPRRPTPALAALALAAAGLSAGPEPSWLLAAAAALAVALGHPATAVLGLPGAAALAAAAAGSGPEAPLVVLLAGAAAVGVLVAARGGAGGGAPQELHRVQGRGAGGLLPLAPAGALAVWLLLCPGSWGWTGAAGPGRYDRGALVAAAAAGITLAGRRALDTRRAGAR